IFNFFFQAEDGIRDFHVTGVQTCALPISAPINNHNVALSGGTEKSNYLFSLDYMDQKGTLKEAFLKRYSARLNTSFKIGEFIERSEERRVGKECRYMRSTRY